VVVGFALISAIFGIFQVGRGGLNLGIYPSISAGFPIGFFANRNHEADLLLIAMPFSARLINVQNWPKQTRSLALAGSVIVFSLAVISTQSRTATALLPLSLLAVLTIWVGSVRDIRVWRSAAMLIVALIAVYFIVRLTPIGARVSGRFSDLGNDLRPHIWDGTRAAIANFWPVGSGVGTFPPVYNMFEDLNSVGEPWVNHAHNDYLELLLVAGLPAACLLVAFAILFVMSLLRRLPFPLRGQRQAGVGALLILLAHSVTDYPLRTFALLTIFAFAAAMLYPSREVQSRRRAATIDPGSEIASLDLDHA
jgi:O-antigen ligase